MPHRTYAGVSGLLLSCPFCRSVDLSVRLSIRENERVLWLTRLLRWGGGSDESKKPRIRWGIHIPQGKKRFFWGGIGWRNVTYRDYVASAVQKRLNQPSCSLEATRRWRRRVRGAASAEESGVWGAGVPLPTGSGVSGGGNAPFPQNFLIFDIKVVGFCAFWWYYLPFRCLMTLHVRRALKLIYTRVNKHTTKLYKRQN